MKKSRLFFRAALACLCMMVICGAASVYAATAFYDYTFDEGSGVMTVHSDVPEDALWPGLEGGSVKEIVFDDGVTEIGNHGFYDYVFKDVTKITFAPSVKKIGDFAFIGLEAPVREYVFSEGLEEIGYYAFSSTGGSAETLVLPSTLKRIGGGAFRNFRLEHLCLPSGVEYIGPGAFTGVKRFDDSIGMNYTCMGGCLYNKDMTKLVQYPYYAPDTEYIAPASLKSIGEQAIDKPVGLSVIVLPEGFEDVEDKAVQFNGASYESIYYVFPTTLKHIGSDNFNSRYYPICYRGTKEQWAAVDIESRGGTGFGSAMDESMMFYEYDITGISLPEITLPRGASVRLRPDVSPREPQTEGSVLGRSTFAKNNRWVIWSLDENGEVLADDTVITRQDYVDGSIGLRAKNEGEGGVSVYAYGRHAIANVHVKANTPGPGSSYIPPAGAVAGLAHPGETVQLSNEVMGADGTPETAVYASDDEEVATVTNTGLVSFHNIGTATITANYASGLEFEQEFTVEKSKVAVKSVKLSAKKLTLKKGKKKTLKVKFNPSNATNKKVTFKTSNKKVATVSSKGVVKAKKKGKATITVITKDGKKKATCKVVVK